jgi:hypothetical protein
MAAPKIIYTGANTILLGQYPINYKAIKRYKKVSNTTDGGIVETDSFHSRTIYYLRFELLTTAIKDSILALWAADGATGVDFDWYLDSGAGKTADVIWNPGEDEPQIEPMSENPTQFWTWNVELWELLA